MSNNTNKETGDSDKVLASCPLCGSENFEVKIVPFGKDFAYCDDCGAKWHVYVGVTGLRWTKLEVRARDGTGAELLGKRIAAKDWRKMAEQARIDPRARRIPPPRKETEIVIQQIAMISCSNCRGMMPEDAVFCPKCGIRRKS